MRIAEKHPTPIGLDGTSRESQQNSRLLYGILVQVLNGRALSILKLVPPGGGFEAWRRLVAEYEPETPLRHAAMLRALVKP
eukprot:1359857-Heterocapsa_arctica.AAC.1